MTVGRTCSIRDGIRFVSAITVIMLQSRSFLTGIEWLFIIVSLLSASKKIVDSATNLRIEPNTTSSSVKSTCSTNVKPRYARLLTRETVNAPSAKHINAFLPRINMMISKKLSKNGKMEQRKMLPTLRDLKLTTPKVTAFHVHYAPINPAASSNYAPQNKFLPQLTRSKRTGRVTAKLSPSIVWIAA